MDDVKIKVIDSDKIVNAINEGSYDVNLSAIMALGAVMSDTKKQVPPAQPETCAYWDRESNFCALHRPSAQFKRINKGTYKITESDKISYAVICDKFPNPHVYFNTYDEAEHWAKFNQPNHRPYYIVKRSEHFEIVREVR